MRSLRNSVLFTFFVVGSLLVSSGCITQRQVKEIVAQSNAAMVTPAIDKAGDKPSAGWQDAVAKIDQLVDTYPEQTVLVNHLRLRAAMVLTVNQQDSLARQRWNQVDGSALTTERDKALFNTNKTLVWWYTRAPNADPLDQMEIKEAENGIKNLDDQLKSLKTPDIRIYLGTIRSQMALKLRNGEAVDTPEQRRKVAEEMAKDLKSYVDLFAAEDIEWVQKNKNTAKNANDLTLSALRNRIWLRELILEFKRTAHLLLDGNPEPDWQPDWIKTY